MRGRKRRIAPENGAYKQYIYIDNDILRWVDMVIIERKKKEPWTDITRSTILREMIARGMSEMKKERAYIYIQAEEDPQCFTLQSE